MTATTVYVDVDGTLVGPGGDVLSGDGRRLVHALLRCREAGIAIVPVTGRGRVQVRERLLGLLRGQDLATRKLPEAGQVRALESAGDEVATAALYDGRHDLDGVGHRALAWIIHERTVSVAPAAGNGP